MASLGFVLVAGPPVEAVIALSIVFVAAEIVRGQDGQGVHPAAVVAERLAGRLTRRRVPEPDQAVRASGGQPNRPVRRRRDDGQRSHIARLPGDRARHEQPGPCIP